MTKKKQFSDSQLKPAEEERYLNTIFQKHYDNKLKTKYADILKNEHGVIREGLSSSNNKKGGSNMRIVFMTMVSLAACGLLAFLVLGVNSGDYMKLTDTHLADGIFMNQELLRGDPSSNDIRNKAILSYNAGEMPTAIGHYEKLESQSNEDSFFKAMAYMYNKQYVQALEVFNAIDLEDFKYKEEINWFKSLCFIKTNQNDQAVMSLNKLNSWKKSEAQALIKKLNKAK